MFSFKEEADLVQDREDLIAVVKMRFGDVAAKTIEAIYEINELDALDRLILVAANAPSLQVFLEELHEDTGSFRIVGERFNPMESMLDGGNVYGTEK